VCLLDSLPIREDIDMPPPCLGPKPGKSRTPPNGGAFGVPRMAPRKEGELEEGEGGGILRAANDGGA